MVAVPKPVGIRSPDLLDWIRAQPCAICRLIDERQVTRTEAAHTPRVRIHGDMDNVIPLCHEHHEEEERLQPAAFGRTYAVDLDELAKDYTARFLGGVVK